MIQLSNENNNYKIIPRMISLRSSNPKHLSLISLCQLVLFNNFFEFKINQNYFFRTNSSRKWIDHGQL